MDKDTLKLKSVIVSNKDSLMQQLKIPEVAWRAGLKGNVIINFDLDSSGIANNIRILSGIGGGTEQAVISTIAKFKFDISQDYLPINSKSISILLIAYFEFKPPLVKINVY